MENDLIKLKQEYKKTWGAMSAFAKSKNVTPQYVYNVLAGKRVNMEFVASAISFLESYRNEMYEFEQKIKDKIAKLQEMPTPNFQS